MRISARAQRIEPFYVMEVAKAASTLAQQVAHSDAPMIFLNIGEPDFTAPPLVQAAAQKAVRDGQTHYTQATGLPALRNSARRKSTSRSPNAWQSNSVSPERRNNAFTRARNSRDPNGLVI